VLLDDGVEDDRHEVLPVIAEGGGQHRQIFTAQAPSFHGRTTSPGCRDHPKGEMMKMLGPTTGPIVELHASGDCERR